MIQYQIPIIGKAECILSLNDVEIPTTVVGSNSADRAQLVGMSIIEVTTINSYISVVNKGTLFTVVSDLYANLIITRLS